MYVIWQQVLYKENMKFDLKVVCRTNSVTRKLFHSFKPKEPTNEKICKINFKIEKSNLKQWHNDLF